MVDSAPLTHTHRVAHMHSQASHTSGCILLLPLLLRQQQLRNRIWIDLWLEPGDPVKSLHCRATPNTPPHPYPPSELSPQTDVDLHIARAFENFLMNSICAANTKHGSNMPQVLPIVAAFHAHTHTHIYIHECVPRWGPIWMHKAMNGSEFSQQEWNRVENVPTKYV